MLKVFGAFMLFFSAINVVGYARQITISDEQDPVSNHRAESKYAVSGQCDSVPLAEPFESIANKEAETEALNPDGFRLLNWNVLKGLRQDWRNDFERLSGASDIVALQEAQLHEDFHAGLEDSELHWDLTTAFHYGDAETGVLTGSGVKPGASCSLHATEPLIRIPKTALVTEYPIQGTDETLLVANIHMINFSFSTHKYRQQIVELNKVIKHHNGPMIIAGDFNTWSRKRMAIINNMVSGLGLSAVEYDDDHRLTVFGNPVDHVYFRGLETIHANTESVESSDHNPMMVTFRIL
jgi:endonuclease/exonuclease/phosphatase (EEP) superfamily protein YafD